MKNEKPFSKPKEIKLRRYRRTHRAIPSLDLVEGQSLLSEEKSEFVFVGEKIADEPRTYLAFSADGEVKQYNWYGRDGDLDGDIQDGTPWQRRSRSIAHLRIGKGKKKKPALVRLRDMPFPLSGSTTDSNAPSKPTPQEVSEKKDIFSGSPTTSVATPSMESFGGVERGGAVRGGDAELVVATRRHNARMRRMKKPIWSRTSYAVLKRISDRALTGESEAEDTARKRRLESFLKTLENGAPESPSYIADNDLLHPEHPWKEKGLSLFISSLHEKTEPAKDRLRKEIHDSLPKASPAPRLPTFGGGADIGGGRKITIDGPGIRQAAARGAVVDDMGKIRCPIGTPGAMQFTNWKLEGCGRPSARRLATTAYDAVSDIELQEFLNAGGKRISRADVAKELARRNKGAITSAIDRDIRRRRNISARLQEGASIRDSAQRVVDLPNGKAKVTKIKKEMRLSSILRNGKNSKSGRITIDLDTGDDLGAGIIVPRSERGVNIGADSLFNEIGEVDEKSLAEVVTWIDSIADEKPADGAQKVAMTVSTISPPSSPKKPTTPPIKGRAQELATQANGDPAEFMRLLDSEGYVTFDFETTGFSNGNVPVSVSAIRYKDGKEVERKTIFMNPDRPLGLWSRANLTDSDGNPMTDEWLKNQKSVSEGMAELNDFVGDSILVAHHLDFDITILDEQSEKAGIKPRYTGTVDTLELSRQIVPKTVQPDHNLKALKTRFKIKSGKWHTSEGDAVAVSGILKGTLAYGKKEGIEPWIFNGEIQQQRYRDKFDVYEADRVAHKEALARHKEVWGTDKKIIRLDIVDVFPEGGASKRSQNDAMKKVQKVADERRESAVVRLTDGAVMELNRPRRTESVVLEKPNPATARLYQGRTDLDAAFSKLQGEDNMNLDGFSDAQLKTMLRNINNPEAEPVPGFEWVDPNNPDHLYYVAMQGSEKLLQLLRAATPEERRRWRMWYDGAHKFSKDMAEKYDISHESAVGILAVLSPTTDWDANVALAEHAIKLATDKEFKIDDELAERLLLSVDKARIDRIKRREKENQQDEEKLAGLRDDLNNAATKGDLAAIKELNKKIKSTEEKIQNRLVLNETEPIYQTSDFVGRSLSELDEEPGGRLFAVHARSRGRSYIGQTYTGDETEEKANTDALLTYKMTVKSPTDYSIESGADLARVQSTPNYKKTLRIIKSDKDRQPDLAVISKSLGKGSKVRSFYNNISRPNDTDYADLTSDTHNFGAATAVPVSSAHEVLDVMFNNLDEQGAGRTYPLFRAMAILTASTWNRETGDDLLPREVQSITWEKIRQIVPTSFPNPDGQIKKDTTLKSYVTDVMATVARITGGPEGTPPAFPLTRKLATFRRTYKGREIELLSDLSSLLQRTPKSERSAAVNKWMKQYGLPELTNERGQLATTLKRAQKVKKDGTVVAIDRETREEVSLDDTL